MNPRQARQIVETQRAIQINPEFFVEEFIGDQLEPYQARIMQSVRVNPITTVRSCHDTGKSFTAARLVLWFLAAFPECIVVTTAPTFRQVEEIIWREVRSAHKNSRRPLGGRLLKTKLDLSEDWYAIGVSSDDSNKIQGFHPKSGFILVIIDEAAGVDEDVFIAADAIMSSFGARLLLIGNPTSLAGTFWKSHHEDPTSSKIAISCFDTPNFINNGIKTLDDLRHCDLEKVEIVKPYLITPHWAKDKIKRWGIDTPMFQARVLGEFPDREINTLIPLNLVEAATTPERRINLEPGDPFIGCDVARYGDDKTVITPRYGPITEPQIVHGQENTSVTTGRIKLLHGTMAGIIRGIMIDCDGVGGGVADQLDDDKIENIVEIYNGSKAIPDASGLKFVNLRSQIYWHLAELFKTGQIWIPDDSELIAQLSALRYAVTRHGIEVERKDDFKKRLHYSPDKADSLAYAFSDFLSTGTLIARATVGKRTSELYNENGNE